MSDRRDFKVRWGRQEQPGHKEQQGRQELKGRRDSRVTRAYRDHKGCKEFRA